MAAGDAAARSPHSGAQRSVAVVGAGWAGLACAVTLVEAGWRVTVFEAGKVAGGRARSVAGDTAIGTVDNGQHLLIGPYRATFALMQRVGVDRRQVLRRLPLALRGSDGLCLQVPAWPLGLGARAGQLGARGLGPGGRRALLRVAAGVPAMLRAPDRTVAAWLGALRQPPQLLRRLWAPLCVAALNTPAERASARVFARVLHDGLLAAGADASIELPARPLGELLPEPALAWLAAHGAELRLGCRVSGVMREPHGPDTAAASRGLVAVEPAGGGPDTAAAATPREPHAASLSPGHVDGTRTPQTATAWHLDTAHGPAGPFDTVVVAVAPHQAAALIEAHADTETLLRLRGLEYEAIATVHLRLAKPLPAATPALLLLHDGPGEWLVDHGEGRLSVVVSAWQRAAPPAADPPGPGTAAESAPYASQESVSGEALAPAVEAQLQRLIPDLPAVIARKTLVEKRATFACTPDLARPGHAAGPAGLWLAGDYTAGPYPATLEGAVRSGVECAGRIGPSP